MSNLTDIVWMILWLSSSIGLGIAVSAIYTKIVDVQETLFAIKRKLNQQEDKDDI